MSDNQPVHPEWLLEYIAVSVNLILIGKNTNRESITRSFEFVASIAYLEGKLEGIRSEREINGKA